MIICPEASVVNLGFVMKYYSLISELKLKATLVILGIQKFMNCISILDLLYKI